MLIGDFIAAVARLAAGQQWVLLRDFIATIRLLIETPTVRVRVLPPHDKEA